MDPVGCCVGVGVITDAVNTLCVSITQALNTRESCKRGEDGRRPSVS